MIEEKGLVHIYTGDGKGKTTAAFGVLMRSIGWNRKCAVIQFLKSPDFECGEKRFCQQHGIELISTGIGFSWEKTPQQQRQALKKAWQLSKEKLLDNSYQLIILDEINCILQEKNFPSDDIVSENSLIELLKQRPYAMDVILTGRSAPEKLIQFSDLTTEMKSIKHPYERAIPAKKGLEY